MKQLTLAVMLFAAPLPSLARDHDDDDARDPPAVIDRGDIAERLAQVDESIASAIAGARGKPKVVQALRRARAQLDAVREQVNDAPDLREWRRAQRDPNRWFGEDAAQPQPRGDPRHPPPPPVAVAPPPAPPAILPISDSALAQLLSEIDRQPSSQGRLRVLQQAAPANYFLVRQVEVVLGRFTFAPDQLQAANLLQPRVLDRENENRLDRWLQAQAPANPYGSLVERASFAARASVKLQPGLYRGNFTVAGSSLTVEGASRDQTVIDGNVVIAGSFNTVRNLTVLGRVIVEGSQNQLRDVDYRGGIEDKGLMNKY